MIRVALKIMLAAIISGIIFGPSLLIFWYNEGAPVSYSRREVLTPTVAPGGVLKSRITAEITKKCISTVYRSIIDGAGYSHDAAPVTRPAFTNYTVELPVPLGAAPGTAIYRARVEWVCNPVQRWFPNVVLQPEIPFIIAQAVGQMQIPEQQGVYSAPVFPTALSAGE